MLSPLAHLFEKLGVGRGGHPVSAGPQDTTPAWPAPAPKPGAVIPKLSLARRSAGSGSASSLSAAAPTAGGAKPLVLPRPDASR